MKDVWHRIRTALERIHPTLSEDLNGPADAAALARAEVALGVTLPEDYRASALIHDGMGLYLIDHFKLRSLAEVIEYWNMHSMLVEDGSLVLGDIGRVRTEGPVRAHKWNRRWIPIATDGGGDARALDLDPLSGGAIGQVITQSRDREQVRVLAPSFRAYLEGFAEDLEQDRYEAVIEDDVLVEFYLR